YNNMTTTIFYNLSLHDALPISGINVIAECEKIKISKGDNQRIKPGSVVVSDNIVSFSSELGSAETSRDVSALPNSELNETILSRSEEHTSELQSQSNLVCRLLL